MKWTRGGYIGGTSFRGYLNVPFSKLVEVFGEPDEHDEDKIAFEWILTFEDGTVATIYDYKETDVYERGLPTPHQLRAQDFKGWHIGGFPNSRAEQLVKEALCIT